MNIQELKLTLDLPSSVNHIYGRSNFGSVYLKKEGKDYKTKMIKYIQEEVKKQKWVKVENTYLFLDEVIYYNRRGRDSDNLKKLTQDAITESDVVWTDDTYCLPRTNRIYIDSNNPRIEIIITPTEFKGIFNSKHEYENFMSNCVKCKRFKRNCSILQKTLDNRITEDVVDNKCLKFKEGK